MSRRRILPAVLLALALALVVIFARALDAATVTVGSGPYTPTRTRIQTTALAVASGGTVRATGNYTTGNRFATTAPMKLAGARYAYKLATEGTGEAPKICAWDNAGAVIECVVVTPVLSSGSQSVTFATVHTIAAWSYFALSVYLPSGTTYQNWDIASLPTGVRSPGFLLHYTNGDSLDLGGGVLWLDAVYSASQGDLVPSQRSSVDAVSNGGQNFAIDPVFVGDP